MPDMLKVLFELQDETNKKFGRGHEQILIGKKYSPKDINNYCDAMIEEIIEVKKALGPNDGYKIWKDCWEGLDKLQIEGVDVFKFCLSMLNAMGITEAEQLYELYLKKYHHNCTREDWKVNQGNTYGEKED